MINPSVLIRTAGSQAQRAEAPNDMAQECPGAMGLRDVLAAPCFATPQGFSPGHRGTHPPTEPERFEKLGTNKSIKNASKGYPLSHFEPF